jgi:hypothetical protein
MRADRRASTDSGPPSRLAPAAGGFYRQSLVQRVPVRWALGASPIDNAAALQDVLPERFQNLDDDAGGTITIDEYNAKVLRGET